MGKNIPMLLNNFNVYDGNGDKLVGVSSELTLPELTQKAFELSAAGMLGSFEDVAIGQFENSEMEISFVCTSKEMFEALENGVNGNFTFRGSIQVKELDGTIKHIGMRVVVRGSIKSLNLGSWKKGEGGTPSFKLSLTYIKIDYDNENVLEIDKINAIYKVNGNDMIADIVKNC